MDLIIVSLVQEDEEGEEEDEGYSSVNRHQSRSSRRARWDESLNKSKYFLSSQTSSDQVRKQVGGRECRPQTGGGADN